MLLIRDEAACEGVGLGAPALVEPPPQCGRLRDRQSRKNGVVAAIRYVRENDEILVVTEGGMLIRTNVAEISRFGRAAQGVRVIRLNEGDRVVSVARAEAAVTDEDAFEDNKGGDSDVEAPADESGA